MFKCVCVTHSKKNKIWEKWRADKKKKNALYIYVTVLWHFFFSQYFAIWGLEMASIFNPLKIPSVVPRFFVLLNEAPLIITLSYTWRRLVKLGTLSLCLVAVHIFKEKENIIYTSELKKSYHCVQVLCLA